MIEECIYHPEFLGSYSIKIVAPVLLGQDVSYDHLAVGDGLEAVCKFQELVQLPHNDPSRADVRKALIDYCKQDTLLMVKLHCWIVEETNNSYKK